MSIWLRANFPNGCFPGHDNCLFPGWEFQNGAVVHGHCSLLLTGSCWELGAGLESSLRIDNFSKWICTNWSKCNYCFKWAKVLVLYDHDPRPLDIFNELGLTVNKLGKVSFFYDTAWQQGYILTAPQDLQIQKWICLQATWTIPPFTKGLPRWHHSKEPPAYVRDVGSTPGSERTPGGGHGNPLQYSCLENPHGQRSLTGCSPRGRKRVRHDLVTWHPCPSRLSSPPVSRVCPGPPDPRPAPVS